MPLEDRMSLLEEIYGRTDIPIGYKIDLYKLTFQEAGIDELILALQELKEKTGSSIVEVEVERDYYNDITSVNLQALKPKL